MSLRFRVVECRSNGEMKVETRPINARARAHIWWIVAVAPMMLLPWAGSWDYNTVADNDVVCKTHDLGMLELSLYKPSTHLNLNEQRS